MIQMKNWHDPFEMPSNDVTRRPPVGSSDVSVKKVSKLIVCTNPISACILRSRCMVVEEDESFPISPGKEPVQN